MTHEKAPWVLDTRASEVHGRFVLDAYSSSFSEWTVDEKWSSQEWKSDELMEARTVKPVYEHHPVCSHNTQTYLLLMTMIWTGEGCMPPAKGGGLKEGVEREGGRG